MSDPAKQGRRPDGSVLPSGNILPNSFNEDVIPLTPKSKELNQLRTANNATIRRSGVMDNVRRDAAKNFYNQGAATKSQDKEFFLDKGNRRFNLLTSLQNDQINDRASMLPWKPADLLRDYTHPPTHKSPSTWYSESISRTYQPGQQTTGKALQDRIKYRQAYLRYLASRDGRPKYPFGTTMEARHQLNELEAEQARDKPRADKKPYSSPKLTEREGG